MIEMDGGDGVACAGMDADGEQQEGVMPAMSNAFPKGARSKKEGLMDTHILLWAISDSRQLTKKARYYLTDDESEIYFSSAAVWEIGIKHAKHPDLMGISAAGARRFFLEMGYKELPIRADHGIAAEALPFLHNDPFDRIMIAQARNEGMNLMSHDRLVAQYGDGVLSV